MRALRLDDVPHDLADQFGVEAVLLDRDGDGDGDGTDPWTPSWNVAPTDRVPAVAIRSGARALGTFRWGLVPSWATDPSVGSRMINARAEGVVTKPAFRTAFAKRRCLVPADGFYEWQRLTPAPGTAGAPGSPTRAARPVKQPWYIHSATGEPLAFAGLWEVWRHPDRPDDPKLRTCTIVTTTANDDMAPLHDRMPVILPERVWERWLDPGEHDVDALATLLVPAPLGLLVLHPVRTDVNSNRNDGAGLIEPIDLSDVEPPAQPSLLDLAADAPTTSSA